MLSPVGPCVGSTVKEDSSGIVGVELKTPSGEEVDSADGSISPRDVASGGGSLVITERGGVASADDGSASPTDVASGGGSLVITERSGGDASAEDVAVNEAPSDPVLELLGIGNGGSAEVDAPGEEMEVIGLSVLELIADSLVELIPA